MEFCLVIILRGGSGGGCTIREGNPVKIVFASILKRDLFLKERICSFLEETPFQKGFGVQESK